MEGGQEKNMIKGEVANINTANIGDHIHYHSAQTQLPKELTLNLPKTHTDDIIGRETDLDELHTLLSDKKRVVVVNGLGGIGKTTLAQAYVFKYYDEYKHIIWITQDYDNITNDFINTAGLIDNLGIDKNLYQPTELFGEVIRKLKGINEQPNLLIIDNAEHSLSQYIDQLPTQPQWHLLVTSRGQIERLHTKQLDFLDEEKTVELFKKHYTHKKIKDKEIKAIVETVDRNTLTIEILAKTAEALRYDAEILQNALRADTRGNLQVPHNRKHGDITQITAYLGAVFNLSVLKDGEIWLMKQFVCLPAEFHNYDILEELLNDPNGSYETVFAELLSSLSNKGWLLQNKDTDSYKMHRVIAEVIKKQEKLHPGEMVYILDKIAGKLAIDHTKDNPVDKFIWVPFGKAILGTIDEPADNGLSDLQNNLAIGLRNLGDYAAAKQLLEKAAASDEKNFGADHHTTAGRYSNLALVLKDLGDYAGAKQLLEKALISAEKNFGADHPATTVFYSNLAQVLQNLGDYAGAKQLLEKVLKSDEKNFGEDHPVTAARYSTLATVLQNFGDYAGAKRMLEKALLSAEKNFGADHPITTTRYSNLATVLKDLGDYAGAKLLQEKAVKSNEKNFGEDHPTTATHYSNLALVLKTLGGYAGAKQMLEKVLKSAEKNFGADHPHTAGSYSNLALVLQDLGDYGGAKQLLEKAVLSAEKNSGAGHPTTATCYSNLALVLQYLGDYAGAKQLLEKVLKSDEKNFGAGHPSTATRNHNLAALYYEMKNYAGALERSDLALAAFKKLLPEGHPSIKTVESWNETIRKKINQS